MCGEFSDGGIRQQRGLNTEARENVIASVGGGGGNKLRPLMRQQRKFASKLIYFGNKAASPLGALKEMSYEDTRPNILCLTFRREGNIVRGHRALSAHCAWRLAA